MNPQDAFNSIVDLLNETMLNDARWPETSALIDKVYGAKGNYLVFGGESSEGNVEIFFSKLYQFGEERLDWKQEYFQHYYPIDEHIPQLRKLPDSKIIRIVDMFSKAERKTSLTYNEALPRYEMQNGLNIRMDGPRGTRIVWGVSDPIDSNSWTSSQLDMISRTLPHIRQYVRVQSAIVEAKALGASTTELLENTRAGIIQLDQRGQIMDTNDNARELLRRKDGLFDKAGSLYATRPEDNVRLYELLARALPKFSEMAESGSMTVQRSSLLPMLALHVKPVASREWAFRSLRVAALVLIVDPLGWARVESDFMKAVLALTSVETEVAILLAKGYTVRQIATETNREYSTVRTHLKNIFAKLGVSRQFDVALAIHALSRLPKSHD